MRSLAAASIGLLWLWASSPGHACALQGGRGSTPRWSSPERLSARGSEPTLSYSTTDPGTLRAFYVVPTSASERMVARARPDGLPFGRETAITDSSGTIDFGEGARAVGIHYGSGTIDLALSRKSIASILRSTDDGRSWSFQRSFSNSGDATESYLPVRFTDDAPDRLRFVYGYIRTLIVPTAFVYATKRECPGEQGDWCAGSQVFYDEGASSYPAIGAIRSVHERGPDVALLCGSTVLHSADNGATFTVVKDPVDPTVDLSGADMARGSGARLWLIRPYKFGPPPNDDHLDAYSSDDLGATWSLPRHVIAGAPDPVSAPRAAVNGTTIVLAWRHADASTSQRYQRIESLISRDDGATWLPLETGVALNGTREIARLSLVHHLGRFSLAYSVVDGALAAGVFLVELAVQ